MVVVLAVEVEAAVGPEADLEAEAEAKAAEVVPAPAIIEVIPQAISRPLKLPRHLEVSAPEQLWVLG